MSALRDTLTGIACDTVACGTVTFPIPAAAELAESPAPWSLPARMQATVSASATTCWSVASRPHALMGTIGVYCHEIKKDIPLERLL